MKIKNNFLTLIIVVALSLRLFGVLYNPPDLYGDELTMVLDVYSLLHTGYDQTGQPSPLTFSMGAGRPAGYIYTSLPFVAMFGPTELGIRLLSILSGTILVFLMYLLGQRIVSKQVGLIAALLTAISPWDLALSQGGFEAHFALMLVVTGVLAFLYQTTHKYLLIVSALAFGLAIHTYPTYKLSLPLLLPLLLWFVGWGTVIARKNWKIVSTSLLIIVGMGLLAVTQTLNAGSETRFAEINILSDSDLKEQVTQKINAERSADSLPSNLIPLFHNKNLEYLSLFGRNYLANFSTDFLFVKGDGNPRHNMGTSGEMYSIELLAIFAGVIGLASLGKKKLLLIIFWLIIAALPPAIVGSPHALRSSFMLPALILISSLGVVQLLSVFKKKQIILLALMIIFTAQVALYLEKTYFVAPNLFSQFWSYPAKLASELAINQKENYDYIILSDKVDNLEYAYPVYARIRAEDIIMQNQSRSTLNNLQFKKFKNVYIGRVPDSQINDFIQKLEGRTLFVSIAEDREQLANFEVLQGRNDKDVLVISKHEL